MEGIPPGVGAVLRPLLPDVAAETIRTIGREVPDYSRPLEGRLGRTLQYGTERALRRFVDSIEHRDAVSASDRRIYVELGRLEMREGRTLHALLAAYRVGAQIAWRRFVEAGERAALEPQTLYRLGEAIFAYIDEISGESIEGYAAEQLAAAGERQRRRERLVLLLAADPPCAPADLRAAATAAGWALPARVAALLVEGIDADRLASSLWHGAVAATIDGPGGGARMATRVLAFLPDPSAPGRRAQVEQVVGSRRGALGPAVAIGDAGLSALRARRALELRRGRGAASSGLLVAAEHLTELLLGADERLAAEFARQQLAPLATLAPAARARLTPTLRCWLDCQGRVDAAARALAVHPQTVRYRLAQLRDAFGAALDDGERRFELGLALRLDGGAERDA